MEDSKGQNMIEYVLLVVAILIVCVYFFSSQSSGPMTQSVNASLYSIINQINNMNSQIKL